MDCWKNKKALLAIDILQRIPQKQNAWNPFKWQLLK
jgi:hypothetical protein